MATPDQENQQPSAKGAQKGKKQSSSGALGKEQATALRSILESTKGNMELRASKLRDLYIQEAQTHGKQQGVMRSLEQRLEKKDSEIQTLNSKMGTLEQLCRELRKQSKASDQLHEKQINLEREKRKEMSENFSVTVDDIMTKVKAEEASRLKQQEDSNALHEKLKEYLSHSEAREKHFEKQLHAKDLEVQLAEAKAAQQESILKARIAEFEALAKGQQEAIEVYAKKVKEYESRFTDTEVTLAKSSDMFTKFQAQHKDVVEQLLSLTKKHKDLEKKHSATSILYHKGLMDLKNFGEQLGAKDKVIAQCKAVNVKLMEKLRETSCSSKSAVEDTTDTISTDDVPAQDARETLPVPSE